jgi:hypothetical protein
MTFFESSSRSSLLLEHDLLRKPVSTPDQVRGRLFRDHARTDDFRAETALLPGRLIIRRLIDRLAAVTLR